MSKKITKNHWVYDVTDYTDIQELMLISDIAITDYSSWIYDFVLTRRPGFLYATDVERYNNITGLCYLLEETPFPVCYNNEMLLDHIRNFDQEDYERKVQAFLDGKESVDDGHSSERLVAEILKQLERH